MIKKVLLLVPMVIWSIPLCAVNDAKEEINQIFTELESDLNTGIRNKKVGSKILVKLGLAGFSTIGALASQEARKNNRIKPSDEDIEKGIKAYTLFCREAITRGIEADKK